MSLLCYFTDDHILPSYHSYHFFLLLLEIPLSVEHLRLSSGAECYHLIAPLQTEDMTAASALAMNVPAVLILE